MSDQTLPHAAEAALPPASCSACLESVTVLSILPFWRYAVGPASGHSPALPTYTLKAAEKLFEEVKRDLSWSGAILYKRDGWSGIKVLKEYQPNPPDEGRPSEPSTPAQNV